MDWSTRQHLICTASPPCHYTHQRGKERSSSQLTHASSTPVCSPRTSAFNGQRYVTPLLGTAAAWNHLFPDQQRLAIVIVSHVAAVEANNSQRVVVVVAHSLHGGQATTTAATKRELFMCRVERGNLVRARLIRHALRLHHLALSTFVHNFGDFLKRHHLWCAVISTGSIALLEWQVSQLFSHTPLRRTNFTKLPVDLLAALLISSILPKRQTSALSRRSPRKLIHCHHASNLSRASAAQPTVQLQSHHEMFTRMCLSPAREHPMTSTVLKRRKATRSRI